MCKFIIQNTIVACKYIRYLILGLWIPWTNNSISPPTINKNRYFIEYHCDALVQLAHDVNSRLNSMNKDLLRIFLNTNPQLHRTRYVLRLSIFQPRLFCLPSWLPVAGTGWHQEDDSSQPSRYLSSYIKQKASRLVSLRPRLNSHSPHFTSTYRMHTVWPRCLPWRSGSDLRHWYSDICWV